MRLSGGHRWSWTEVKQRFCNAEITLIGNLSSILPPPSDIVDAITPYSVLSIRHLLNTSAMDILYYTSPLYGAEVRAGLQKELNRLYFMFASRHPGWQGKVSILAHSLGCVIVYDIVTGWMGPDTRLPSSPQDVLLQGLQFPVSYRTIRRRCARKFLTKHGNINFSNSEPRARIFYLIIKWSAVGVTHLINEESESLVFLFTDRELVLPGLTVVCISSVAHTRPIQ